MVLVIFAPEIFISLSFLFILVVGVLFSRLNKNQYSLNPSSIVGGLSIIILVFAIFLASNADLPEDTIYIFDQGLIFDNLSYYMRIFIFLLAIPIFYFLMIYYSQTRSGEFEIFIIMGYSLVAMSTLLCSLDFITFYLALELQSLAFYILAGSKKTSTLSTEAGLKYFILGGFSSAILLFGISLIYGLTGSIELSSLSLLLSENDGLLNKASVFLALTFITSAILFKISAFPFHSWTPDVYSGAPLPITAFFSILPKIPLMVFFFRFYSAVFYNYPQEWTYLISIIGVATLLIGTFGAIYQTNLKRLLAYSTISHVGFVLIGFSTGSPSGLNSVFLYLIIYVLVSLGIFSILISNPYFKNRKNEDVNFINNIEELRSLFFSNPTAAVFLALFFLSLAGVPPLAGFFGKYSILLALIESKMYLVAIVCVVTSVVSAFYYLRIIKYLFFYKPDVWDFKTNVGSPLAYLIAALTFFNIFFMLFFDFILDLVLLMIS